MGNEGLCYFTAVISRTRARTHGCVYCGDDLSQAGGVGQIKACPCPQPEYVTLMTDLLALDSESGRLVKKSRPGEDAGGPAASTISAALPLASNLKVARKAKPRGGTWKGSVSLVFIAVLVVLNVPVDGCDVICATYR